MTAHLRLASLDGKAVPFSSSSPARPASRRGMSREPSGADHSTFKAMVGRMHDTGLESTLRGLLASVSIVEEERFRRLRPLSRDALPAVRAMPSLAPGRLPVSASRDAGKRAERAIVAADAAIRPGERLVSEAGSPIAYELSGSPWMLGRAAAERRGVPHLGGMRVCYAWGRPLHPVEVRDEALPAQV